MSLRRRGPVAVLLVALAAGVVVLQPRVEADTSVKLDAYAEWRHDDVLVVDGQRVRVNDATKWKGKYRDLDDVPLGDEVRVQGTRQSDGTVLAREIDVRENGENALFEDDVRKGTTELEEAWLEDMLAFEPGENDEIEEIGEIEDDGPRVARVQRLVDRLAPPYVDKDDIRVYVIDNKEWNAMAMGNGAIWVFSGIMKDMTDNELAIVVGHEIAHYTHEHSRREARRGMWMQLGAMAAIIGAEVVDNEKVKAGIQMGAALGLMAMRSGFSRNLEDQADRVGLRYAYEAGFPVANAPRVWQRFLNKYGEENRLVNFFFSDHSLSSARQRNLEQEIRNNYRR